ncbi:MAG: hypothetical protein F6K19_13635 [Cyanothece sp. SIO1E1]|nr:hypothetical protein [Cyanothece sp. SIO1E1]
MRGDLAQSALREQLGNIDQIREILFGPEIRASSNRLEQIETRLSVLKQEVHDRTEEMKQVLSTEIKAEFEALEKKVKTLNLKDNEEKVEIRQQIDRISKQLASNVDVLNETIDQQTTSLRNDFLASRDKLQDDFRGLRKQVSEEMERRIAILTEAKVARGDMAEMLFELGLRLKGSESSLLRQLQNHAPPPEAPEATPESPEAVLERPVPETEAPVMS